MTNSRRQALPVELLKYYTSLLEEIATLRALHKSCLDIAIIDHHYGVISVFIPRIQKRLQNINQLCRTIKRHYVVGGRPPNWYSTVEEVRMTAVELTNDLRTAKTKIQQNRWIEVEAWMRKFIKECYRITEELENVTLPNPDLQVYREELKDVDLNLE